MANIVKTRIQLKYDTLTAWNGLSDDKILKAGEVAAVAIPENTTTDGNGKVITTAPTTLFKVGDGKSTFKALPWLSALAADVHAWAKDDWDTFIAKVDTALSTGDAAYVKATDFDDYKTELANLIGTKTDKLTATTVFGKIAELEGIADAADTLSKANKSAIDTLNGAATVAGSVAAQVKVATEAAAAVDTKVDDLTTEFNTYKNTTAPATYAPKSLEQTKADKDNVYTKSETYTKGEVDNAVNGVKDLITGNNGLDIRVDALETFKNETVPNTYATKKEVADAKAAVIGTTADTETADTVKGAKAYTDKAIENFVATYITEDNNAAIDKLNEVTAWIVDNEDGAAGMMTDIEALQSKVSALEDSDHTHTNKAELDKIADGDKAKWDANVQNVNDVLVPNSHTHANAVVLAGITPEKVTAWDSAEANAIAKATELNDAMHIRVTELEKIDHTHTSSLADIEDAVAKKHNHTNKNVLDGITAAKVTNWDNAEQNAKDYADGLDDAMDTRVSKVEAEYIRVGTDDKMYLGNTETTIIISGGSASDVW